MQGAVLVTATMRDGSHIQERTADFGTFAALVLAFRADPDCRRVVWYREPPRPARPAQRRRGGARAPRRSAA